MKNTTLEHIIMLKALEETNEELAIEAISNPNLDSKELSNILQDSLTKKYVTNDGEEFKLKNSTLMAGMLNRINQIDAKSHLEY